MDMSGLAEAIGSPGGRAVQPIDAHALAAQLGSEVAGSLSSAADRVSSLAASGRISRADLRALRDDIDRARRVAIMGQQVSRLAARSVPMAQERLALTSLLQETVRQRAREIQARGVEMRQELAAVEVRGDATLLFTLLQAVLDWSFEHTCSRIDITLDVPGWPACARLRSSFGYRPADEVVTAAAPLEDSAGDPSLDTLSWWLLQQSAAALGLEMHRRDDHGKTELALTFPEPLGINLPRLEETEAAPETRSSTMAGLRVLLLAPRREVRSLVNEALRPLGLRLECVSTVDEARQHCLAGLPRVVIHEAPLAESEFDRLRTELLADNPQLGFLRIVDHGRAFDLLHVGGRTVASVGRAAIIAALPAALMFELARQG